MNLNISPNNPWDSYHNPFTPPALAKSQLKKIEAREFVDFMDLLPENQTAGTYSAGDHPVIELHEDGRVTHKDHRHSKSKINSFHRWSAAWTVFAQAHLHFHPEDYFVLFKYHALMVQHVQQYKFEACYNYDNACRLTIANETDITDPNSKSAHWHIESDTLRNRYLFNNPIPT